MKTRRRDDRSPTTTSSGSLQRSGIIDCVHRQLRSSRSKPVSDVGQRMQQDQCTRLDRKRYAMTITDRERHAIKIHAGSGASEPLWKYARPCPRCRKKECIGFAQSLRSRFRERSCFCHRSKSVFVSATLLNIFILKSAIPSPFVSPETTPLI